MTPIIYDVKDIVLIVLYSENQVNIFLERSNSTKELF